jgi:UDP-N-acetylglucosamine 2-epimerase (non-hydrolysing)
MKKIMIVFGTRPEAIKMAPLLIEFKKYSNKIETICCVTAQHREMLDQVLGVFDIIPDFDLNIMTKGQDLSDITSRVLLEMRNLLIKVQPDIVFVHGDTTTSTAAALAAFYQKIPVAHIEAGLRTHNIYSPWPEELNRQITSRISLFHYAPTLLSKQNLLNEGIIENSIKVVGNTVIDALLFINEKINSDSKLRIGLEKLITNSKYNIERLFSDKRLILITAHRRENFGDGFINIYKAIKHLTLKYKDVDFVYPLHLNPEVRNPIDQVFGNEIPSNLFFIEPLDYTCFIYLMNKSYIIITDSGGIQEEAPSLGKPVLVMRDTTERPEAVDSGTVQLVGTNINKIIDTVSLLLDDDKIYNKFRKKINPYGDGFASKRIVESVLDKEFNWERII